MHLTRFGFAAIFAALVLAVPAMAQSVVDQADELELSALDLEKAGDYDGAVAKHRDAIKLIEPIAKYAKKVATFKENFETTLVNAATAKFNAKDQAGALALLEEALAQDPAGKNAVTKTVKQSLATVKTASVNQEGLSLMKAGNAAGAVEKFKQVLALDPTNKAAQINLDVAEAQVLVGANDPAGAVAKMQDAVNLDPTRQFLKDELAKLQAAAEAKAAADAKKAAEEAKKAKK